MSTAARQRMTHRALVERTVTTPADDYGGAPAPAWETHIAAMPCWFYTSGGAESVRQRGTVVVEQLRMLAPSGTDITEQDRINSITDRAGGSVYAGLLNVGSVLPAHGHLELRLEKVSG